MDRSSGSERTAVLSAELRTVFQPIVDLTTGTFVGVEALTRARSGDEEVPPDDLFAAAARTGEGALRDLDERCLAGALARAAEARAPGTVFVNVEPATLGALSTRRLAELASAVAPGVRVVVEVTERDLLDSPAELLAGVRRARECGWGVALDDVGAEPAALALMPFLAPDVIKLDLALVRQQPSLSVATTINAVHAQAERSGALILAEGIETEEHLERALATGARLGQGWRFGRPADAVARVGGALRLPPARAAEARAGTPFAVLSAASAPGVAGVPLLAAMSRQLERQALLLDDLTVVLANFQHVTALTTPTRRRYEALAEVSAFTAVLGPGMPAAPVPGVHGTHVPADDPLAEEWAVCVVGPHYAAAIAAREEEPKEDGERRYAFVLTHDRTRVVEAATLLLERVRRAPAPSHRPSRGGPVPAGAAALPAVELPELLLRAIDTATNGITIADAQQPDWPLVYVNQAFLELTGYAADEVLGRNCRLLQGPKTDPTQVRPIARQLAAGRSVRSTLLNYRRDGSPFWNEVTISPVLGASGEVTHFIGNQDDVTERVQREERASFLAYHDLLTGLPNRVQLLDHLELELARAIRGGHEVAVLFLDLNGFKGVNDTHGHAAGDIVLSTLATRMRGVLRSGDLLARYSGDEFVAVLAHLPAGDPAPAQRAAGHLAAAAAVPVALDTGVRVTVGAAVGIARSPHDGSTPDALLDVADRRMYEAKA
ncbi:PAS domain S-box-containing protein/diguanylate cyclase (GGDEF)-like protein [Motilibacter rhizosphaerae]|uniref:PAS domain S-box-containing protein/diguanylate cyclase (GGDEF)-like protein n=1 Tax=Motilibacter rhizosphaerae TaxID=598652 RepID=A0A4Q7NWQ2_9ACTN|nr:diguanylate cyclase [Motilibacter rhizosphaerae]RZS91348.1 PAS domain S-box-containing protein/diguanylate cyclase (GGDEF)-like protein [Motilibacter rhizosphaerae]